jgi:DNA-binding GntR family transcriptional regulator
MHNESLAQILSPTVKRSLADDVAERLRNAITHGQLAPEEPLREAELSELMGVSRGPIREALSHLEREGLVVIGPTGRKYVARLSHQDLDEVYSVRRALERLAVEYACMRATSEDLDKVQAVVDAMASAIERGISAKEAAELDLRFHDAVFQSARHKRLLDYWATLRPQVYIFVLSRNVASADFRDAAVRGHQELLNLIKARNKQRALDLIEEHMRFAYDYVIRTYEHPGAEPDQKHSSDGSTAYPQPFKL